MENPDTSKQPDELDLTLGWHNNIPLWNLDVGLATTYINNAPLDLWWEKDVWLQATTISKTYVVGQHVLKPQIRVEWISRTKDIGGGALILMPNISHTWKKPLGIKPLSIVHQAFVIHDDGFDPPGNDSKGVFLRWNAGLKWQIAKNASLTLPGFCAQVPIQKGDDGRGQATSWGTSFSISF